MKRALLIACVLVEVVGCGGQDKAKFYTPPSGHKDAGPDTTPDDAGPSNGPELKFTMPDPATNPADDTVITTGMVIVHCSAKQRTGKSKVASVAITLDKFDETTKPLVQPATTKIGDTDEYEAKFDVSDRPNGAMKFHCAAKDAASMPNSSAITLDSLLDLGPKIEVQEPKDLSIHALRTPVVVKFRITAQPLGDDDDEGAVKSVKLLVSGMAQEISESEDTPGSYQASIDFNDRTLFMVPPTSAEIVITASNGRTPVAATRSVKSDVKIDGDGPTIHIDTPVNATIVHGEVLLKVTVEDVSGVMPGTLIASINDDLLKITDWDVMGSTYQHTFDTRPFGVQLTQLTINLAATDVVGNQTDPPAALMLRLDNLPPLLSLDPPPIREFRIDKDAVYCSELFDPVGRVATNDTGSATQASYYRVLIEDQTNHAPGSHADYYAGVDRNKVVLYAQPDPSIPLLIDTNGDKICDEINFTDLPETKQPRIIKLTALDPRGTAYFPNYPSDYTGSSCSTNANGATTFPPTVCDGTEMFRVVPGRGEGRPPAVYGYNPTNGGNGECEGTYWEVQTFVDEGWRCLAARAEDTIGNVGVSAPLRVCFDDGVAPPPSCPLNTAPDCTKSCKIDSSQKYAAGMMWEVQ